MEHLLGLVGLLIEKKDTKLRKAIPGSERVVLTLRFSASGDSQVSLTYLFQIGKTSVNRIVSETREPIIKCILMITCSLLQPKSTVKESLITSKNFGNFHTS